MEFPKKFELKFVKYIQLLYNYIKYNYTILGQSEQRVDEKQLLNYQLIPQMAAVLIFLFNTKRKTLFVLVWWCSCLVQMHFFQSFR